MGSGIVRKIIEGRYAADDRRILFRNRIVSQALRTPDMPTGAARAFRVDEHMPH